MSTKDRKIIVSHPYTDNNTTIEIIDNKLSNNLTVQKRDCGIYFEGVDGRIGMAISKDGMVTCNNDTFKNIKVTKYNGSIMVKSEIAKFGPIPGLIVGDVVYFVIPNSPGLGKFIKIGINDAPVIFAADQGVQSSDSSDSTEAPWYTLWWVWLLIILGILLLIGILVWIFMPQKCATGKCGLPTA